MKFFQLFSGIKRISKPKSKGDPSGEHAGLRLRLWKESGCFSMYLFLVDKRTDSTCSSSKRF